MYIFFLVYSKVVVVFYSCEISTRLSIFANGTTASSAFIHWNSTFEFDYAFCDQTYQPDLNVVPLDGTFSYVCAFVQNY